MPESALLNESALTVLYFLCARVSSSEWVSSCSLVRKAYKNLHRSTRGFLMAFDGSTSRIKPKNSYILRYIYLGFKSMLVPLGSLMNQDILQVFQGFTNLTSSKNKLWAPLLAHVKNFHLYNLSTKTFSTLKLLVKDIHALIFCDHQNQSKSQQSVPFCWWQNT